MPNQILNLNDLALSELSKNVVSGKIRLGIPSEFATILLPKIVSRFAKAYPNITLEVNCELSKKLLSKAGKDSHDLILALEDNPSKTWSDLVKTDELVWVASAEHSIINPRWCPLSRQPRAASIASGPQHCWIRSSNPGRLSTPFQT
jgi:DNA-binding transcriptional LysR family regulator